MYKLNIKYVHFFSVCPFVLVFRVPGTAFDLIVDRWIIDHCREGKRKDYKKALLDSR